MNVTDVCCNAARDIFRLGKISEEEVDKLKLKNLQNENIYVNPYKSKKEQEEFRRIVFRRTI